MIKPGRRKIIIILILYSRFENSTIRIAINTYQRLTRIHKYWIAQMNTIPYVRCKWLNRCNNIWQGGKRPFPGTWRPFYQRFWFLNLHNHFCLWMSTLKNRNGILLPKLFWPTVKKNVLVIEKDFWNLRLKSKTLQKIFYRATFT